MERLDRGESFFPGEIARSQNDGGIAACLDLAGRVTVDREIHRNHVVVEQIERPDIERRTRQIHAAGRFGEHAHQEQV
jgi:hypothetical protein